MLCIYVDSCSGQPCNSVLFRSSRALQNGTLVGTHRTFVIFIPIYALLSCWPRIDVLNVKNRRVFHVGFLFGVFSRVCVFKKKKIYICFALIISSVNKNVHITFLNFYRLFFF